MDESQEVSTTSPLLPSPPLSLPLSPPLLLPLPPFIPQKGAGFSSRPARKPEQARGWGCTLVASEAASSSMRATMPWILGDAFCWMAKVAKGKAGRDDFLATFWRLSGDFLATFSPFPPLSPSSKEKQQSPSSRESPGRGSWERFNPENKGGRLLWMAGWMAGWKGPVFLVRFVASFFLSFFLSSFLGRSSPKNKKGSNPLKVRGWIRRIPPLLPKPETTKKGSRMVQKKERILTQLPSRRVVWMVLEVGGGFHLHPTSTRGSNPK